MNAAARRRSLTRPHPAGRGTPPFSTVGSVGALPEAVDREMARVARLGAGAYAGDAIPPLVRDTVDLGRRTWRLFSAWRERAGGGDGGAEAELLDDIVAADGGERWSQRPHGGPPA